MPRSDDGAAAGGVDPSAGRATRRSLLQRAGAAMVLLLAGIRRKSVAAGHAVTAGWADFRGRVIPREDPRYERWRASMCWYLHKPRRYPDVIVQPHTIADAIRAVRHARDNGMRIAVRSTGHNPPGGCLRDGGMLLDLSHLRAVTLDGAAARAWVQPGRRSEEFIDLTGRIGYAFPAAHTGFVGLGGYLLGGGLGWNWQAWDVACRSVTGAKVITADGELATIGPDREPELFWALRGAGPGFPGAVVDLEVRLYPLPAGMMRSQYFVPAPALPRLIPILEAIARDKQRQIELLVIIGGFPAPGTLPAAGQRNCVVNLIAFADTAAQATAMLDALPLGSVAEISIFRREKVPITYADLYRGGPTDHWSPFRTAVSNMWTDSPGAAVSALAELWERAPSPRSFVLAGLGVNPRRDDADTLLSTRAAHYVSWYLLADNDQHVEPNRRLMDRAVERTRRNAKGRYVNEIDPLRYPAHVRECYPGGKWSRLQRVRAHYDPERRFFGYLGDD